MQITIDTHHFVKFLERKKHFTHEQAETLVEASVEFNNDVAKNLVTKQDLKELELRAKHDIIIKLGSLTIVGLVSMTTIILTVLPSLIGK